MEQANVCSSSQFRAVKFFFKAHQEKYLQNSLQTTYQKTISYLFKFEISYDTEVIPFHLD